MSEFLPGHLDRDRGSTRRPEGQRPEGAGRHRRKRRGHRWPPPCQTVRRVEDRWRPTARVEAGLTADQKAALRIRLNLLRRSTPPTASQRREYVRTLLRADAELSNGTVAKLCGMDPSNVSRICSEMEAAGLVQQVHVTKGLDGRTLPKPTRSERPKTAPKATSQTPSNGKDLQLIQLPQGPVCSQANHESSPLPSTATRLSAAEESGVLKQPAAANNSPEEAEEGRSTARRSS